MEYLDTLRRYGWLPDPTDKVRVVVMHRDECPSNRAGRCGCQPRLVLAAGPSLGREEDLDGEIPSLDRASGE